MGTGGLGTGNISGFWQGSGKGSNNVSSRFCTRVQTHWVKAVEYQRDSSKGLGMGSFTVVWVLKYMWGSGNGILMQFGHWNVSAVWILEYKVLFGHWNVTRSSFRSSVAWIQPLKYLKGISDGILSNLKISQ